MRLGEGQALFLRVAINPALHTRHIYVDWRSSKGGETGIRAVTCLEGAEVWRWTDGSAWAGHLLETALTRCEERTHGSPRDVVKEPVLFVLEYTSGLESAVYLLNGLIEQAVFAATLRGAAEPLSTELWLQPSRPFSHFSGLAHYIEQMIVSGRPAYPVERTLLTTGALAAIIEPLCDSRYARGSCHQAIRSTTPTAAAAIPISTTVFYLSGPPAMLKALSGSLLALGVAAERVRIDAWE